MEDFDFQETLEQLRNQFRVDVASLALVIPEEDHVLKWHYMSGNQNEHYKRIVLQSGHGLAGEVYRTGKPIIMPSVSDVIPRSEKYLYPIVQFEKLASCLVIPLFKRHRVEAVLLLATRNTGQCNEQMYDDVMDWIGARFGPFHATEIEPKL
ncbi:GAF domain-containing protein [Alkalibacillus salilacus]|uniref:Nitrogen regulatory protein A n=1 Tax=Alkalibacillus salilacus TaxID=284582 RepID=A0ABT9VBL6_9BACI|nr:GAF domain-containing protein [Alkalibacillus salilacus]MDQ0158285.1 nitrogen regulatory protein A [Alkalibacillus salilacus]